PERLKEIADACSKATPGPWAAQPWDIDAEGTLIILRLDDYEPEADQDNANAHFVALARSAVPELLQYIDTLEAIIQNDVLADSPAARELRLWGLRQALGLVDMARTRAAVSETIQKAIKELGG